MKKMLRYFTLGLVAVLALCLAPSVSAAEEKVIYVSDKGNDSANGSSSSAPKKTLSAAITALGSAGGKVVVCGPVTLDASNGNVMPACKKTVTITSVNGTQDFRSAAKINLKTRLEFKGPTVLEQVNISAASGQMIFANGNDFTVGADVKVTLTSGGNYPYIFGGAFGAASSATAANNSFSGYTIRIDSGSWCCVRGGNYRNGSENPSGYIGDVRIVINGGTFAGGADGSDALGVISLTSFCGLDGDATLEINGGTIQTSIYLLGRPGSSSAGNVLSNRGNVTLKITGGKLSCTRIAVAQNPYAPGLDGDFYAEVTGVTTAKNFKYFDCAHVYGAARVLTDTESVATVVSGAEKTVFLAPDGNDAENGLCRATAVASVEAASKLLAGDKGALLVLCGAYDLSALDTSALTGTLTVTANYFGTDCGGSLTVSGTETVAKDLIIESITLNGDGTLTTAGHNLTVGENVTVNGAVSLDGGKGESHSVTVCSGSFVTVAGGSSAGGNVGVAVRGGSVTTVLGSSGERTGGMASVYVCGGTVATAVAAEKGAAGACGVAVYGGTVGAIESCRAGRISGDFCVTLNAAHNGVSITADAVVGAKRAVLLDGAACPDGFTDGGKVIFLSSGGTADADGFTPATASLRPFNVIVNLQDKGIPQICVIPLNYTLSASVTLAEFGGSYVFGGTAAGIDWRLFENVGLRLGATLSFGGEAVVDNLHIVATTNEAVVAGNCHALVIGKNVTTERYFDRAVDDYPSVCGGYVYTSGTSVELAPTDLTVWSGTWNKCYGGNLILGSSVVAKQIKGDVKLTVNGGTFTGGVSPVGMSALDDSATLTVNGGTFACSVYGVGMASPSVGKNAKINGNVTLNLNGGEFRGDILFAERAEDITFTGHYTLNLAGGDYSRINAVKGVLALKNASGATDELNVAKTIDLNAEQTGIVTVENPIADYADPSVYYCGGWYYYTYSLTYQGKPALWMTRAANFADLSASIPLMVWSAKETNNSMTSLWAPQIYFLDGKWYIYATCSTDGSGESAQRRPYVWVGKGEDPYDGFDYFGIFENCDLDVYSYLSPRVIEYGGTRYLVFGGFFRKEDKVSGVRHYQRLFIVKLASPTKFATKATVISYPTESWEIDGKVSIQEGPFPIITPNGTLYLSYAAGQTAGNEYCTGLLRFTGTEKDDLTDATKWTKLKKALQFVDYSTGVYSPGAMVYVTAPDGTGLWGICHVKLHTDISYAHRVLFAAPVTFVNDVPTMTAQQPTSVTYEIVKNAKPLASRIETFGTVGTVEAAVDPIPTEPVNPADTDPAVTDKPQNPDNRAGDPLVPVAIGAAAAAVAAVGAAVVILKKKKK